eukprot:TRINITY_DN1962_c0_g1_i1.p1 TRINITY_DN1962_c0_g1~~TRINITY_DN1962_c0_g1_i1.p1  ORF type:complete len:406 (+),score=114.58 TRINITY_DN1962_c0_g1_i1:117-1334(+)
METEQVSVDVSPTEEPKKSTETENETVVTEAKEDHEGPESPKDEPIENPKEKEDDNSQEGIDIESQKPVEKQPEEKEGTFEFLKYFSVALFAIGMGLGGLTLVWKKLSVVFPDDIDEWEWKLITTIHAIIFLVVSGVYLVKAVVFPKTVLGDWNHPIRSNFMPTIVINILLFSIALADEDGWVDFADFLFHVGAIFQMILSLILIGRWKLNGLHPKFANPSLFIPAVGNLLVPVAGGKLGYSELPWLFYAGGMVFWVILEVSIMQRFAVLKMVPPKLVPSLFILLAPPAIAQVAYSSMVHTFDLYARLMTYTAVFHLLLLLRMGLLFVKTMWKHGFQITWWAYTFPLCATTISVIEYYAYTRKMYNIDFLEPAVWILVGFTTFVLIFVSIASIVAIAMKKFIVKE